MNKIYNSLKRKRKYVRKPLCQNIDGMCTFEKCRCDYAIKVPKTKQVIDENLHHRMKVIKRRRQINAMIDDIENRNVDGFKMKGYVPPKKETESKLMICVFLLAIVLALIIILV